MPIRWMRAAALLLLAGCQAEAPANRSANQAAPEPEPVANATAPDNAAAGTAGSPAWLVGSWSYGEDCATDFAVHYNSDGTLINYEDEGRWALEGDTVTETITRRTVMGEDEVQTVNPPEVRRYTVEQVDRTHGVLTYDGRKIPILRC